MRNERGPGGRTAGGARAKGIAGAWLVAAGLAVAAAPCAAQQPGSVRGTVVADVGDRPLQDVVVFVQGSARRALTRSDGTFLLGGLAPGTYTIVAEGLGFGTARTDVRVRSGEASAVELRLEEAAIAIPEVVVIASRDAKDLSEVAASVGVIGGGALREAQVGHPSEVMGQVPGVYVNVTGGEGHMTAIRQPLSTAPVYLYLEDGVPIRSTGFFNHNALYEVNVPQADRIEVMKGPANAMYGSDAIGGVINVGTRAPAEELEGELSVEGGEHGYRRTLGSVSGTFGGNGLRADANVTRTDGWRAGTGYDRYSGTLRWDRSLGAGASIESVVSYSHVDQSTAGSSGVSRADFEQNPEINYTPISYRRVSALRVSSALEAGSGAFTWAVTPFARLNSMDMLPNWSLTYDPAISETENASVGLLAKARWDLGRRVSLTAGADLEHSPGRRFERTIVPEREGSVFTDYEPGPAIYDYDVTFQGVSPYLHAEATPVDRLHVSAGVRLDLLRYAYDNHLPVATTGAHRRPADASQTFEALSPKLGVTFEVSPGLDLFASYRRGFRAPSEGQLFRQGSATNTVGLAPVKADSWEVGGRGGVGGVLSYEISAYHMTKRDDILDFRLPDGSTQATNAGETLHRGVEIGLGVQIVRGVSVEAAYSVAEHTYEDWRPDGTTSFEGKEQELAPNEIGNVRLRLAPSALPGSVATLEWSRIGPYWMDAANEHEYEGHALLHLRLAYEVADGFELFGRVTNLTDARYAERASYTAFRGQELSPGLPRTLYLGARVR